MRSAFILCFLLSLAPGLLPAQTVTNPVLLDAMSLYRDGQINKAREKINILRTTHTDDTTYAMALSLSMEMEEKDDNYEQALRDNEDLLKLSIVNEKSIRQNIGRLKKNIGDFPGAEQALKRVIVLDRFDGLAYLNLAILYNYTDRYRDAVNILKANADTAKTDFDKDQECRQYARAYLNMGSYDTAKQYIETLLSTAAEKNDEMTFYQAALIYHKLNDKAKSCKYITESNRLILENKIDETIKTAPENIKKRWFYTRYAADIETIKKCRGLFCN